MDIQATQERVKVDSNNLAAILTSGGVGAGFAYMLLRWLLNHQTKQLEVSIELQRQSFQLQQQALQRLDRVCELLERGES